MIRVRMEICFLDFASLLDRGRASLKLSASGCRHPWVPMTQGLPWLSSKAQREGMLGRCVEGSMSLVEVGLQREGQGLGWPTGPCSFHSPLETLDRAGGNELWGMQEQKGKTSTHINPRNIYWALTMWQAPYLAWVHCADQQWSSTHHSPTPPLGAELSAMPTFIFATSQCLQVPQTLLSLGMPFLFIPKIHNMKVELYNNSWSQRVWVSKLWISSHLYTLDFQPGFQEVNLKIFKLQSTTFCMRVGSLREFQETFGENKSAHNLLLRLNQLCGHCTALGAPPALLLPTMMVTMPSLHDYGQPPPHLL